MNSPLTHLGQILREGFRSPLSVALNGGTTILGNPVINNGYEGDGATDGVVYEDRQWAEIGNKFTFFMRVKSMDDFTNRAIYGASSGNGPMLRFTNSTSINIWNDTGATALTFGITAPSGPFTIAVTYDNSTQVCSLYIDGVLDQTQTFAQTANNSGALVVGARLTGNDSFDGKIEEFELWSRVMSANEILKMHNKGLLDSNRSVITMLPLHDRIGSAAPFTTTNTEGVNSTLGNGSTSSTFPAKISGRNGYSFDGTSDYITVPHVENIRTICVWADNKPDANFRRLISKGDNDISMLIWNDGTYRVYFQNTGVDINSGITPSRGLHMFSLTFDGSTVRTYVDDVAGNTSARTDYVSTDDLLLGAVNFVSIQQFWNSDIYKVLIFDEALTPLEIENQYLQGAKYFGNL